MTKTTAEIYLNEDLEFFIFNAHVLDWIQDRDAICEPALDLQDTLPQCFLCLVGSQVFGHEHADVADAFDRKQQDRENEGYTFLAWKTGL